MSKPLPFFVREGDSYVPTDASLGYWGPGTLTGRVIGGLLGFELERVFGEVDLVPARFTVDLLRLAPCAPVRIATRTLRWGGRLKMVDAEFICDGELIARASCQFLRVSENPANPTWQSPNWNAPPPLTLSPNGRSRHWEVRPIGPEHQRTPRTWATSSEAAAVGAGPQAAGNPPVLGPLAPIGARQAWVRETRELVGGVANTPFTRLAAAADFASPLANSSESGIDFVNSDFTLYIHRLPTSEWIGFELVGHQSRRGVAIGECWIYDEEGPIGSVNTAAIAQRQR
jgi:acyl-CoA thioesterase